MNLAFVLSSVALGVSLVLSAAKLLDWWLQTDPRTMIRTGRLVLVVLAVAAIPTLVILLVNEMWVPAMLTGALLILVPTALNWRRLASLRPPRRERRQRDARGEAFRPAWREGPPPERPAARLEGGRFDDDAIAARAAEVLQAYSEPVRGIEDGTPARGGGEPTDRQGQGRHARAARPPGARMSRQEALSVLGLGEGADVAAVRAAHRRLVQMTHPDRGGSNWLAAKVNEAKTVLLAGRRGSRRAAEGADAEDG